MSRSYKRIGITPTTTSDSEKQEKIIANRIFRRRARQALKKGRYSRLPYRMREVSDVYSWGKDGRICYDYTPSSSLLIRNDNKELHKWYRRK